MPFDPALPATGSEVKSAELRAQFNALNDLITNLTATVATQAAQIAALQALQVTAIEIVSLSYDSIGATMEVAYAATGGDNATVQTLVWWVGSGSPNRTPLTRPSQTISLAGVVNETTYWQTEVQNAAGATVLSGVQSYFVN